MSEKGMNLRWNNFEENLVSCFKNLRTVLNDVTIYCGLADKVTANKFVLSAGSEVFRQILVDSHFSGQPNSSVLLYDVEASMLSLILDFLYYGEVRVTEADLNDFLNLAKKLRVKGLTLLDEEPTMIKTEISDNNALPATNNPSKRLRNKNNLSSDITRTEDYGRKSSKSMRIGSNLEYYNDSSSTEDVMAIDDSHLNPLVVIKTEEATERPSQQGLPAKIGHHLDPLGFSQHSSEPSDFELMTAGTTGLGQMRVPSTTTLAPPSFRCNLCVRNYRTKDSLQHHMNQQHPGFKNQD